MSCSTIFERSLAMVLRPDVDELVIAATEQELFQDGFAVDRFETVTVMQPDEARAKQLIAVLQAHVATGTCRRTEPIA